MGLRTVEGVALAELAALNLDPATVVHFRDEGLLVETPSRLIATRNGRQVLDRLTLELAQSGASV